MNSQGYDMWLHMLTKRVGESLAKPRVLFLLLPPYTNGKAYRHLKREIYIKEVLTFFLFLVDRFEKF
jgi:hypothetical protein